MALVLYSSMLFFPGGDPAAGASINISLDASNVAPLIFADSAGTIPAANPMTASGMGMISFYAAPGYYLAELAGTFSRIMVDPAYPNPVHPDIYVHTQAVAALTWTIDHFYGVKPDVSVVSNTGDQVEPEIDHPSNTQTLIKFSSAQTGTAYLRR